MSLYGLETETEKIGVTRPTTKDAGCDFTVVCFPFVRASKKAPDATAAEIGQFLKENVAEIGHFEAVKGFLNLTLDEKYWTDFLFGLPTDGSFGRSPKNGQKVMVEFSSPNTNKPLHLGHVRNICLGWSISRILDAVGFDVIRCQIINDRGYAICKSMLAWQKFGGKTPAELGQKGDHMVGDFYVLFEQKSREEYSNWQKTETALDLLASKKKADQDETAFFKDFKKTWERQFSQLAAEARAMLLNWEKGDAATIELWKSMNGWVYEGFDETYRALGVAFDKLYFESETYLLGKDIMAEGLEKGVFFRRPDGSVAIDLTDAGLWEETFLRADGSSLYLTQDLGTAEMRHAETGFDRCVYVVADEQNGHFSCLFETLKRLGRDWASGLFHLSYGMVELPNGRMKSREGTVVDADDLIAEVVAEARREASERGAIEDFSSEEKAEILRKVGLGALKYFILKVNPRKKMIFDPSESVELQGHTGPYIQYAYVRTNGLRHKIEGEKIDLSAARNHAGLEPLEKDLLGLLHEFPAVVESAARDYDPSHVANFAYELAKTYSKFWHELPVLKAESAPRAFRLEVSQAVGRALFSSMDLLGIEMPERM